jgi:hypothetical protein
VVDLSVRRLYCRTVECPQATFVEQVEGLTVRHQRRTPALQRVVDAVAVALGGKAGARLLGHLHQTLSWTRPSGPIRPSHGPSADGRPRSASIKRPGPTRAWLRTPDSHMFSRPPLRRASSLIAMRFAETYGMLCFWCHSLGKYVTNRDAWNRHLISGTNRE